MSSRGIQRSKLKRKPRVHKKEGKEGKGREGGRETDTDASKLGGRSNGGTFKGKHHQWW
jgi:hypothetical protein